MRQISTSVQQTTEVVVRVATAPTMRAASPVTVYLDTQEMDSAVLVSHRTLMLTNTPAKLEMVAVAKHCNFKAARRSVICQQTRQ